MSRFVLPVLAVFAVAGIPAPAAAQAPADYSAYPCLSYTLPCGQLATRRPEARLLDGALGGDPEAGRQVAQARNRGNCLACHAMRGGVQPGTRGPDLTRYGSLDRSDAQTYAAVWDMRTLNPQTLMPPFGTNAILTDREIRDVVAFLQASR